MECLQLFMFIYFYQIYRNGVIGIQYFISLVFVFHYKKFFPLYKDTSGGLLFSSSWDFSWNLEHFVHY